MKATEAAAPAGAGRHAAAVAAAAAVDDEAAERQEQLAAIEATFEAARAPPVHKSKPGMRAVEVMEGALHA
jgi:RNA polymerase II-associated factor 1